MKSLPQPPQWAVRFLEWFCPYLLFESVLGDLLEEFDDDVEQLGERKARARFIWNVISFFRPGILLRNNFKLKIIDNIMFNNYFKIALRNIRKRKLYSFINAFGLSIAIAFCVLIYLFIKDERSFDQFHKNKSDLFVVARTSYDAWGGEPTYEHSLYQQLVLGPQLQQEVPEVKRIARFKSGYTGVLNFNNKSFEESFGFTDSAFFKMFSFPLLSGDIKSIFKNPDEMVITTRVAERYFGNEDPVGKAVEFDFGGEKRLFTISGLVDVPPSNSSLQFNILIPMENHPSYEWQMQNGWRSFSTPTFIQLEHGADTALVAKKMEQAVEKFVKDDQDQERKELNIAADIKLLSYHLNNIEGMHMNTKLAWDNSSDPQYSYILAGIALLILVIACINYVSLSLSASGVRRKEVGVRKAIGAHRNQLISQFTIESIALAVISMIFGFALVFVLLPYFNDFTSKQIHITWGNSFELVGLIFLLALFIGVLAGSYPSLFLSSFKTSLVLKGSNISKLKAGFTKPLVVLQFALSSFLIISSLIMYKQMEFITTKDLGYNNELVLVVNTHRGYALRNNGLVEKMRVALQGVPDVKLVSGSNSSFGGGWNMMGYTEDGKNKMSYVYDVDPYYIPLLDIEILKGRNFDPDMPSDSNAVIVNEALVKDMGWTDPLSEHLNWEEDEASEGARVIGVMKDYNFLSLQRNVEPLFLKEKDAFLNYLLIKIEPDNIPETIALIEDEWSKVSPDKPFSYSFLDDDVARQYDAFNKWMNIMGLATGFAIIISCLGLFGLSGINALNKTKEIGIRKVFGAEVFNIFILLNRQFVWLAIISFLLAAPVAWYIMSQWLEKFEFSIELGWQMFVFSMLSGLLVALITVSYHGIKSAFTNPADTLKYE
ncbi:ABC transporter permease [Fulvivirga maritima]|uniref:ABC transporter permease n=1 Tax=Fulvivirga maritima TaxID=2904247 RepID=UPI001F21F3A0|nr:ABC transporter permease [Fulvivirga maritima]UII26225.1 ABC transporter permease [Fulvivirga maritima]